MSITLTQEYTVPATGLLGTATITIDVTKRRLDSDTTAQERVVLKASASSKKDVYIDIDKIIQDALSGRPSSAQDSNTETYVVASTGVGQTALSVLSSTGFSAGDPVAIMDDYNATNVEYAFVSASSANLITIITNGSGLTLAHKKYSILQNLKTRYWGTAMGNGPVPGIKAQYEQPASVTGLRITSPGAGKYADVLFTESTSTVVNYYDIYASRVKLTTIAENREPDYADAMYTGSRFNVSTYHESNNQSYALQANKKFWFYVVPKTVKGQRDTDEGDSVEGTLIVL